MSLDNLVKSEELLLFLLCFSAFLYLGGTWYGFLLFLLLPDIGMLGYLVGPKVGAFSYNVLHYKGVALVVFGLGLIFSIYLVTLLGIILFAHSSLDRALGYGLKKPDGFKSTHLGRIGK